jgi:hypothetical protein
MILANSLERRLFFLAARFSECATWLKAAALQLM